MKSCDDLTWCDSSGEGEKWTDSRYTYMHTYKHSQDTDKCTDLHVDEIKQNLDVRSEDKEG